MNTIVRVESFPEYRLKLTFQDGMTATVDVRPLIGKGFAQELLDPERFNQVSTEPGGGVAWPIGFDLCPEFLRGLAEKRRTAA